MGDIVKVTHDGEIPCDMILLISSHTDSKCYLTTANLDGETNLKVYLVMFIYFLYIL